MLPQHRNREFVEWRFRGRISQRTHIPNEASLTFTKKRLVCDWPTSDICRAVLPRAPSSTIARPDEMLKGEKKIFLLLSSLSLSFLNKSRAKVALSLEKLEPIVPEETRADN